MYLKAAVIISFLTGSVILLSMFPAQPADLVIHHPENQRAVVVELFTSQGCSSCPAADRLLSEFISKSDEQELPVYGLSFHVDYWNRLGWKDPFSAKAYTDRQYAYARKMGQQGVYTPQMVVNGEMEFVGSNRREASVAINTALSVAAGVEVAVTEISLKGETIRFSYQIDEHLKGTVINFALVERGLTTTVKRGENGGRTLHNDNVVRVFLQRSAKEDGLISIELPENINLQNSSLIVYIQQKTSFEILGATRVALNALAN
jgi:hypothetical protein